MDRLGTGARQAGGRWNLVGTAVIYAGKTVGIVVLEGFVHTAGSVPLDLVLVRIVLPQSASSETATLADLPRGWNMLPPGPASMHFGSRWAQEKRSLALYVPSAIVPEETIAILSPDHPEFRAVRMEIEREFRYDSRMLARRKAPKRAPKRP